jgi:hypothetical protein
MKALWMKKLPHNLVSLRIPFVTLLPDLTRKWLPDRLSILAEAKNNTVKYDAPNGETFFSESLFSTLLEFTWFQPRETFLATIHKFQELERLDIKGLELSGSDFQLLPQTLKVLSLCVNSHVSTNPEKPIFQYCDLMHLPRSLEKLSISRLPSPCSDARLSNTDVEFLALLPQSITHLTFRAILGPWDLSRDLGALKTQLLQLRTFELFVGDGEAELASFDWVPYSRLNTLQLVGISSRAEHQDKLFSTLPQNHTNIITRLHLDFKKGQNFSHAIFSQLPPKLMHFFFREPSPNWDASVVLSSCPRSLTSLVLTDTLGFKSLTWKESDLLSLSASYYSRDPERALSKRITYPSAPSQLRVLVVRTACGTELIGDGVTDLTVATLASARSRCSGAPYLESTEPGFLCNESLHFPISLTRIALPLFLDSVHPIWNLPSLTSLRIISFNQITSPTPPTSLKSLTVLSIFPIDWLEELALSSLTDLTLHASMSRTDFKTIRALSLLTTLSFGFFHNINRPQLKYQESGNKLDLQMFGRSAALASLDSFLSIPVSVTSLNVPTASVPIEYWNSLHPSQQFSCLHVPLSTLEDCHLRKLAPYLKEISLTEVIVTDIVSLHQGLDRGLDSCTTDLHMIQSLCPHVTSLNKSWEEAIQGGPFASSYRVLWQFKEDPTASVSIDDVSINFLDELDEDELDELDKRVLQLRTSALQALPPYLTELHTRITFPNFGRYLPQTLTKLRFFPTGPGLDQSIFSGLPQSLTYLAFTTHQEVVVHFELLPRGLKTLIAEGWDGTTGDVSAMPPSLTELQAFSLFLRPGLPTLPETLTTLAVERMSPLASSLLPRGLTSLTIVRGDRTSPAIFTDLPPHLVHFNVSGAYTFTNSIPLVSKLLYNLMEEM